MLGFVHPIVIAVRSLFFYIVLFNSLFVLHRHSSFQKKDESSSIAGKFPEGRDIEQNHKLTEIELRIKVTDHVSKHTQTVPNIIRFL